MTRYSFLTKAQHAALHADIRAGGQPTVLAARYGVSAQYVRYHVRGCLAADLRFATDSTDPHTVAPDLHRQIHQLMAAGATDEAVMASTHLPWTDVRHHRGQHCDWLLPADPRPRAPNIPTRTTPTRPPIPSEEVIPMNPITPSVIREHIAAGEDLHTIAETLDVPFVRVRATFANMAKQAKHAGLPTAAESRLAAQAIAVLEAKMAELVAACDAQTAALTQAIAEKRATLAEETAALVYAIDRLKGGSA